jgi:hypothetical protein
VESVADGSEVDTFASQCSGERHRTSKTTPVSEPSTLCDHRVVNIVSPEEHSIQCLRVNGPVIVDDYRGEVL